MLTGGAGFIGTHTCVELLEAGYQVVIYDNFCNSRMEAIDRIAKLTGKTPTVVRGDLRDQDSVKNALADNGCDAVIHLAGLKAVGESVEQPLRYYECNVAGSAALLRAMQETGIKTIVFSSSSTVYGIPENLPLTENHPLAPTNPYGKTKLIIETMLHDLYEADPDWRIGNLRYFNPIGAHASGLIGEDPQGVPNNLMPFVAQVAIGQHEKLSVWGNDYPTPDGTGVRDYLHIVDLAQGHLKALQQLQTPQYFTVNLGTGRGYSVLEVVAAFEAACGRSIPYQIKPRRPGDVAAYYADPTYALELLGWKADRDLQAMCKDAWNWQQKNPHGYA
ncbi:MAG: UDP-glucose 4-epimerase GalE [Gammaproteobacteria bacterium]